MWQDYIDRQAVNDEATGRTCRWFRGWNFYDSLYYTIGAGATGGFLAPDWNDESMLLFSGFFVIFAVPTYIKLLGDLSESVTDRYMRKEYHKEQRMKEKESRKEILDYLDVLSDGKCTFYEFILLELLREGVVTMQWVLKMRRDFQKLDKNGDGYFDLHDLAENDTNIFTHGLLTGRTESNSTVGGEDQAPDVRTSQSKATATTHTAISLHEQWRSHSLRNIVFNPAQDTSEGQGPRTNGGRLESRLDKLNDFFHEEKQRKTLRKTQSLCSAPERMETGPVNLNSRGRSGSDNVALPRSATLGDQYTRMITPREVTPTVHSREVTIVAKEDSEPTLDLEGGLEPGDGS